MDIEKDLKRICDALRIDVAVIKSKKRTQEVSDKRTAIVYAMLSTGLYGVADVGNAVNRDRSTIISCIRRVNAWSAPRMYYNQMRFVDTAIKILNERE